MRFEDYEESEETDLEDSSERIDLRPSLLVRVSQLSSFFIFWLYDASNPDSTYSKSMVDFDTEPKTMQEIPHFNKKARIIPIVWAQFSAKIKYIFNIGFDFAILNSNVLKIEPKISSSEAYSTRLWLHPTIPRWKRHYHQKYHHPSKTRRWGW